MDLTERIVKMLPPETMPIFFEYSERLSIEFCEWCELEGWKIRGLDDASRRNVFQMFLNHKTTHADGN